MIGTIGLIASLVGSAVSAAGSAATNRKRRKELDRQEAMSNSHYLTEMFTNPAERADNAAYLQMLDRKLKKANEVAEAKRKITGATQEQAIARQQANANAYADAVSRMAAIGQQRRDMLSQQKLQQDLNLSARRGQMEAEQLESFGNLASNAVNLGVAAIGTMGSGGSNAPKAGSTTKTTDGGTIQNAVDSKVDKHDDYTSNNYVLS